eukprot:146292-Pleurochrysis_carterae.AAC.1
MLARACECEQVRASAAVCECGRARASVRVRDGEGVASVRACACVRVSSRRTGWRGRAGRPPRAHAST